MRFDAEQIEPLWDRDQSAGMSRRQFLRWLASGGVAAVLAACAPQPLPRATGEGQGVVATPTVSVAVATPRPTRPILQNENRPGFFVRYYKAFEAVDPASWTLSVTGLVRHPQNLTLSDIQSLPLIAQVSRMKCVECWSAPAKWEGFRMQALLQLADPLTDAKWVHFFCADDYFESLRLEDLLGERVLFVHRMNDQLLPDVYGAPLRLMVPFKYGYKSPKAITRLVLAKEELVGYWSQGGYYSTDGDIEPGVDHPLDLGGIRRITSGEVKYPDGVESKW